MIKEQSCHFCSGRGKRKMILCDVCGESGEEIGKHHLCFSCFQQRKHFPAHPLFEKLADIEHQRWADWQRYLHSKCQKDENGLLIKQKDVLRWERQINTPYCSLTEIEKDSDREQVLRYWDLIRGEAKDNLDKTLL